MGPSQVIFTYRKLMKSPDTRDKQVDNGYVTALSCSRPQFKSQTWQLKLMPGVCVCMPKIPRGEWRRRDCSMAIPPGGDFSLSVFLCLSGECTCPIVKTSIKKKKKEEERIT